MPLPPQELCPHLEALQGLAGVSRDPIYPIGVAKAQGTLVGLVMGRQMGHRRQGEISPETARFSSGGEERHQAPPESGGHPGPDILQGLETRGEKEAIAEAPKDVEEGVPGPRHGLGAPPPHRTTPRKRPDHGFLRAERAAPWAESPSAAAKISPGGARRSAASADSSRWVRGRRKVPTQTPPENRARPPVGRI